MSEYTATEQPAAEQSMRAFKRGFAKVDRESLAAAVTDDFEWHQHYARGDEDLPTGRILVGVDALVAETQWRAEHWSSVRYENLEEREAGDLLVQTFTIQGVNGCNTSVGRH